MARVCRVTGKISMLGNNVSHAHNKTSRAGTIQGKPGRQFAESGRD